MDLDDLLRAMDQNRLAHERDVAEIRQRGEWAATEQCARLARTWCSAMQVHYRLLNRFLELRRLHLAEMNRSNPVIDPWPLRAPALPTELPKSLSRYVFVGVEAKSIVADEMSLPIEAS